MTQGRGLVLGIGNLLWADEGFGVRAAEWFAERYRLPDNLRVLDGGTQGLYLVHHVQDADTLLVFDAVDYGLPPGTLKIVEGDAVPKFLGAKKMSLHQTGFQEVLATAEMLGSYPSKLLLVGVQPFHIEDFGGGLTDGMTDCLEPAVEAGRAWLVAQGFALEPAQAPLAEPLAGFEMSRDRYEGDRPSAAEACRVGDERVLRSDSWELGNRSHPLSDEGRVSCDVDPRSQR